MMCPDHGAIDHVGSAIPTRHFRQGFEHRIEYPGFYPSSVAPEHAVPLAIFIGKMPPLRTRPRHPHHAFKIEPIVPSRTAPSASLRWQQRPDQRPFFVRYSNPLTQGCLPKDSLESAHESQVKLCPRNLAPTPPCPWRIRGERQSARGSDGHRSADAISRSGLGSRRRA